MFSVCHQYTAQASLRAQLVKNLPALQETWVRFLFDSWVGKILWRRDRLPTPVFQGFPLARLIKNLPAMQETWVGSLGWKEHLEKGKATHCSVLNWRIPWSVAKSRTRLSDLHSLHLYSSSGSSVSGKTAFLRKRWISAVLKPITRMPWLSTDFLLLPDYAPPHPSTS